MISVAAGYNQSGTAIWSLVVRLPRDTHYSKTQEMAVHLRLLSIKTYADLTLRCQDMPNFLRDLINVNLLKLGKCSKC